jgi:hypothetical protein
MNTVDLSSESVESIAQRVAELLRAPAPTPQVLTRGEAKAYVKRPSEGAFVAWCKRWKIRPASHGRYARAALDLALEREGGLVHTPATLRAHQEIHAARERARRS